MEISVASAKPSQASIDEVAQESPAEIGRWVHETARQNGVTIRHRQAERFARAASRLADAETNLDYIEELLIALSRAQLLTPLQRGQLQVKYLR